MSSSLQLVIVWSLGKNSCQSELKAASIFTSTTFLLTTLTSCLMFDKDRSRMSKGSSSWFILITIVQTAIEAGKEYEVDPEEGVLRN